MKALVLAGGRGTRLEPLTNAIPKQLIPVANKPVIFYVLEQIVAAGISDVGMVVSPANGATLEAAIGDGARFGGHITYVIQETPLGIAHAVKTARGYLGDDQFLLFLGDNLLGGNLGTFTAGFDSRRMEALIMLKEVANPSAFGVAELDELGQVARLVEKPARPKSNLAVIGAYIFGPSVHEAIDQIAPSGRGELEITDAIQKLIDSGKRVGRHVLRGWWFDTGSLRDVLEANRTILEERGARMVDGEVDMVSRVVGPVRIGRGTKVVRSTIEGPTVIGAGCVIKDSAISAHSSIGAGTVVENSAVGNSIILEGGRVSGMKVVGGCLLGPNTVIEGGMLTDCVMDTILCAEPGKR